MQSEWLVTVNDSEGILIGITSSAVMVHDGVLASFSAFDKSDNGVFIHSLIYVTTCT